MSKLHYTSDGWATTDLRYFHLIADREPPRRHSYWFQLCNDATHKRPLKLWATSVLLLGVAWYTGEFLVILPAMGIIVFYFHCFFQTIPYIRDTPSIIGVIDTIGPHPFPGTSAATALLPTGRKIPVAVETLLVEEMLQSRKRIELLILDDPHSQFSMAFGARPV